MSAAHDAHADASAGHHDAHDHFDNEPATELGADEPRTPSWVPFLGIALFFLAGVAWLVSADGDKPADTKIINSEAAATPPPTPQVLQVPPVRPALPVQPGQPGQPGAPNVPNALKQLTPEQARELQKQMEAIQGLHNPKANPDVARPVPQPGAAPQPGTAPQRAPQPQPIK